MDDLGPKRIEALQKEADKWNTTAEEAERSIQNITVNYFKETSKALAGRRTDLYWLNINWRPNTFVSS